MTGYRYAEMAEMALCPHGGAVSGGLDLVRSATTVRVYGVEVLAADLVPILRRMKGPGRDTDQQREALAAHLLPGNG